MRQWEKVSDCLHKKMQILETIADNTETQFYFIRKREMIGLKRVLRERDALIKELITINEEFARDQNWTGVPGLTAMIQDIAHKQQQVMDRSRQVLQEAIAEQARIAAELRKSKVQRQIKNQYVNPYAIATRGYRINEKG